MPAPIRPHPTTPTFPIATDYLLLFSINKFAYFPRRTTRNPKNDSIVIQLRKIYIGQAPYAALHSYSQLLGEELIILSKQSQSSPQQKRRYLHLPPLLL